MPLIEFLIIIVALGVLLWAVNTYVPMQAQLKKLLNIVVVLCTVLWILSLFGVFSTVSQIRIGR